MAGAASWVRSSIDLSRLPRIKLNTLQDLPGALKKERRVGRGPGSKRGKTCGRGHKGQGQRNPKSIRVGFEGGQTPFYIRVPKHGFKNKFRVEYKPFNLGYLQHLINTGRVDPSQPIDMCTLNRVNTLGRIEHGIKLLADGADSFTSKVDIEVSRASKAAIDAIERNGGTITTTYFNKLGLRVHLKPEKYEEGRKPRQALPDKYDMKYYLNPENRGYLLTEKGEQRLKEGNMAGAYLGDDGRVHIPGKKVTLYSEPSPPKDESKGSKKQ